MEEFWNQPRPKKPVAADAGKNAKSPAVEDDEEENWENDLVEHSYNPVEVVIEFCLFRNFTLFVYM